MNTQLAIQETDLELVVSEKTLGSLTTNAKQIRNIVMANLPKYDISNYTDDNIDQAKKDKVALNKAAKVLNAKRLEIEKEFMKPFGEFKEVITETVKLIGDCSAKIDVVVKQNEQQYKDKKLADIRTYFDGLNANFVDFNKVYRPEWLNKSASMKSVCVYIDAIFSKVENELSTLQGFGEDFDVLRTYYMDTLNINNTIQYANRLKEQRERAKAAQVARIKAQEEARQQEKQGMRPQNMNSISEDTQEIQSVQQELLTRTFKVTTTRENIIALGNFMNEHGIDFDKIEVP